MQTVSILELPELYIKRLNGRRSRGTGGLKPKVDHACFRLRHLWPSC